MPSRSSDNRPADRLRRRAARVWIPVALVVAAVVAAVAGSPQLAAVFVAAAAVALVADLWIRLGMRSQDDRDDEADARRYFTRKGRWPGDRS